MRNATDAKLQNASDIEYYCYCFGFLMRTATEESFCAKLPRKVTATALLQTQLPDATASECYRRTPLLQTLLRNATAKEFYWRMLLLGNATAG